MKDYLFPTLGIVIVTIILIAINELTDSTLVQDYAYFFIIGGMLLGVVLAKFSGKDRDA